MDCKLQIKNIESAKKVNTIATDKNKESDVMSVGKLYCACRNRTCLVGVDFNPNTLLWRPTINGRVVQFYTHENGRRCVPVFADRQFALDAAFYISCACKYNHMFKSRGI